MTDPNLPSFIPRETWDSFVEMRAAKGKRAPFTDAARRLLIGRLSSMRQEGIDIVAALEQSIINGWSGVFPARDTVNHSRRELAQASANHSSWSPSSKTGQALDVLQGMKR